MTFPRIEHIDDLLPHLDENFHVTKKDGVTIVGYHSNSIDTFPVGDDLRSLMRREARGIAFSADGKIMSRPFHKFFNLGERWDMTPAMLPGLYNSTPLEKLDGSMIRPFLVDGVFRMATKNGITDVAAQAEKWIGENAQRKADYTKLFTLCIDYGATPIFEWCSRYNKIVIDYPNPDLILIAIRDNVSGSYYLHQTVVETAKELNITHVNLYAQTFVDARDKAVASTEDEGIVSILPDGQMIKVKSSWYVQLHRAKESVARERDVVSLILSQKLDDLKPLLSPEDLKKLNDYESIFWNRMSATADTAKVLVDICKQMGRKEFAIKYHNGENKRLRALTSVVFKWVDNPEKANTPLESLGEVVLKPVKKSEFAAKLRALLDFEYDWTLGEYV